MEVLAAKKRVVDCLEKSLELAPYYRPTYELLVEVYRELGRHRQFRGRRAAVAGEVSR